MNSMEKIDRNFAVTAPQGKDRAWLEIEQAPFQVYGLMREGGRYVRLPCAVAEQVSEGVAFLNGNTAGGRVRFATDSPVIGVRAVMHSICKMPHFTLCGSAGFDLYEDTTEKSVYRGTFMPPYEMEDGYESELFVGITAPPSRRGAAPRAPATPIRPWSAAKRTLILSTSAFPAAQRRRTRSAIISRS